MNKIKRTNSLIKHALEDLICQHKQQHLYHQEKLRKQVIAQYLQFNACLSQQERQEIKRFVDQNSSQLI